MSAELSIYGKDSGVSEDFVVVGDCIRHQLCAPCVGAIKSQIATAPGKRLAARRESVAHAITWNRPFSEDDMAEARRLLTEWGEARGLTAGSEWSDKVAAQETWAGKCCAYLMSFSGEEHPPSRETTLKGWGFKPADHIMGNEEQLAPMPFFAWELRHAPERWLRTNPKTWSVVAVKVGPLLIQFPSRKSAWKKENRGAQRCFDEGAIV